GLEDGQGKELAWDNDSGGGEDAWLRFVAPQTGRYRLLVTSFQGRQTGAYFLTVQRFAGAAPAQQRHAVEIQATIWAQQAIACYQRGEYAKAIGFSHQALQW